MFREILAILDRSPTDWSSFQQFSVLSSVFTKAGDKTLMEFDEPRIAENPTVLILGTCAAYSQSRDGANGAGGTGRIGSAIARRLLVLFACTSLSLSIRVDLYSMTKTFMWLFSQETWPKPINYSLPTNLMCKFSLEISMTRTPSQIFSTNANLTSSFLQPDIVCLGLLACSVVQLKEKAI